MRRASAVLALLLALAIPAAGDCLNVPLGWKATPVAFNVREVTVADFDGDGDTDVAAVAALGINQPVTRALVFRNDGAAFAAPVTVYLGNNLRDIEAVDVTGDNRVDLVLADADVLTLIVLPGRPSGTFGTPIRTTVLDRPNEFTVADFTGDGDPDIAAITATPPALTVYANAGDGEFIPLSQITIPQAPFSIRSSDLDRDGTPDVMIGHFQQKTLTVAFGFGDGGFLTPLSIASGNWVADTVGVDLDADGDREIVTANFIDDTIGVHMNDGGRAFRAPVAYNAGFGPNANSADPRALAAGDFSGDGRQDVALATLNGDYIVSFTGNGNGTLRGGNVAWCFDCQVAKLVTADVNRDGRLDLVTADPLRLSVFENHCGVSALELTATPSSITAGSAATLNVFLSTPLQQEQTRPTGSIVIREGTRTVATIPAESAFNVTVQVEGLAVGEHTFVAQYNGDDDFEPVASKPAVVTVFAQASTVTLTQTSTESALGQAHRVTAHVDAPTGKLAFEVDGVRVSEHPAPSFDIATSLSAGTHTLVAKYLGDASHAPAQSAPLTHTVAKATPLVNVLSERNTTAFGQTARFLVAVEPRGTWMPTGTVRLKDGATIVASATLSSLGTATIETTAIARGERSLRVEYAGDANFHTATSAAIAHEVTSTPKRRSVRP